MMDGRNHGLVGAGCTANRIGLNDMTACDLQTIEQANDTIRFNTASGNVWATSVLPPQGVAFKEEISP